MSYPSKAILKKNTIIIYYLTQVPIIDIIDWLSTSLLYLGTQKKPGLDHLGENRMEKSKYLNGAYRSILANRSLFLRSLAIFLGLSITNVQAQSQTVRRVELPDYEDPSTQAGQNGEALPNTTGLPEGFEYRGSNNIGESAEYRRLIQERINLNLQTPHIEQDIKNIEAQISDLQSQKTQWEQRVLNSSNPRGTLEQDLNQLTQSYSRQGTELGENRLRVNQLETQVSAYNNQISNTQNRIATIKSDLTRHPDNQQAQRIGKGQIAELERSLTETKSLRDKTAGNLQKAKDNLNSLPNNPSRQQVQSVTNPATQAQKSYLQAERESLNTQSKINDLKGKLIDKRSELQENRSLAKQNERALKEQRIADAQSQMHEEAADLKQRLAQEEEEMGSLEDATGSVSDKTRQYINPIRGVKGIGNAGRAGFGFTRDCSTTKKLYNEVEGKYYDCEQSINLNSYADTASGVTELGAAYTQAFASANDGYQARQSGSIADAVKAQRKVAERGAKLSMGFGIFKAASALFRGNLSEDHAEQADEIDKSLKDADRSLINRRQMISDHNSADVDSDGTQKHSLGYLRANTVDSTSGYMTQAAIEQYDMNDTSRAIVGKCSVQKQAWLVATPESKPAALQALQQCMTARGNEYLTRRKSVLKKIDEKRRKAVAENNAVSGALAKGAVNDLIGAAKNFIMAWGQSEAAKQLKDSEDNLRSASRNAVIRVEAGDPLPGNEGADNPFRQGTTLPSEQGLAAQVEEEDQGELTDPTGFDPGGTLDDTVAAAPAPRFVPGSPNKSGGLAGGGGGAGGGRGLGSPNDLTKMDTPQAQYNNLQGRGGYGGYASGNGGGAGGNRGAGGKRGGIDPMAMLASLMGGKEKEDDKDNTLKFSSKDGKGERKLASAWNGLHSPGIHIFHQVHRAYQIQVGGGSVGR